MGGRSKISRLPLRERQEIERLALQEGRTGSELAARIRSKGVRISLGAIKRHVRQLKDKMERYREAQEIAAVWVARIGKEPQGDAGRLLLEMLRMVAFRQLADIGDRKSKEIARPAEIAVLAKAIREMEAASKTITERDDALREKLRTDVDRKAEQMKRPAAPGDVATLEKAKELVRGLL